MSTSPASSLSHTVGRVLMIHGDCGPLFEIRAQIPAFRQRRASGLSMSVSSEEAMAGDMYVIPLDPHVLLIYVSGSFLLLVCLCACDRTECVVSRHHSRGIYNDRYSPTTRCTSQAHASCDRGRTDAAMLSPTCRLYKNSQGPAWRNIARYRGRC